MWDGPIVCVSWAVVTGPGTGVEVSFSAEVWEVSGVTAVSVGHELVGRVVDPDVNSVGTSQYHEVLVLK